MKKIVLWVVMLLVSSVMLEASSYVIAEKNVLQGIEKKAKVDAIHYKRLILKIVNDNSKLTKLIKKDPLLQQELKDATDKSFDIAVVSLAVLFDEYDDKAAALMKDGKVDEAKKQIKLFETEAEKLLEKIEKKALADVNDAYSDYQKKHSEYRNYKLGSAFAIGKNVASITVSAVGLAGSAGVSTVQAVVSITRAIFATADEVRLLSIDAEGLQKEMVGDAKSIVSAYNTNKVMITAKETGKAALNKLVGANLIPTLNGLKDKNKRLSQKTKGIYVKSHKIAKELNKILGNMDALDKEASANKNSILDKLEATVQASIGAISELNDRYKNSDKFEKSMDTLIKDLKAKRPAISDIVQTSVVEGPEYAISGVQLAIKLADKAASAFDLASSLL